MAAVTLTANTTRYNINGSFRETFYQVSGNSGDTLDVGFIIVNKVIPDGVVITAYTTAPLGNGQTRITFTSTGAYANNNVVVLGK